MIYYPISALINAITSTIVCIIVITRNPKSQLNRSFSYFAFSVASWSYCYFLWQISNNATTALFWCHALMAGAIFIPSAFLHFSLTLIGQRKKYLKIIIFWYMASVFFFLLDFTSLFIKDVRPRLSFPYWPTAGVAYAPFLAMFIGLTIYAHILMYKHYKRLSGYERNQIKYVFLGTAVGFLGGSTNYPLWYDIPILPLGNVLVAVYVFLIAYAIAKYRLMDINVALTRAGIFGVVYALVLGFPFWLGYTTKSWFPSTTLAVFLATLGPFIYNLFRRQAENRLLKEQRRYQEVLRKAARGMTREKDLKRLLSLIVHMITKVVKLDYAAIYLLNKSDNSFTLEIQRGIKKINRRILKKGNGIVKHLLDTKQPVLYEEIKTLVDKKANSNTQEIEYSMKELCAALIIPSFFDEDLLGFIVLGNKISGATYSQDDITVFSVLADYAALAIEYAQFIRELEEIHVKLREAEKLKGIAQLMHSLNHELLNLFNKMSMPIQLIMMGDIDPHDKVNFDNTLKTINDAMEISIEILGYISSYRNKSKSQESKATKIEEAIDSAINRFLKKFQEANIQVIKNIQPNLPAVQAKETFDELFIDILANSYFALIDKAQGDRLIEIDARLSEDKNAIQIKMSDTGPDMTKSTYMCDKDSPFKERGKIGGVNFGLAYLITNQHDGGLMVESYEKGGTTFVINIPITQ